MFCSSDWDWTSDPPRAKRVTGTINHQASKICDHFPRFLVLHFFVPKREEGTKIAECSHKRTLKPKLKALVCACNCPLRSLNPFHGQEQKNGENYCTFKCSSCSFSKFVTGHEIRALIPIGNRPRVTFPLCEENGYYCQLEWAPLSFSDAHKLLKNFQF